MSKRDTIEMGSNFGPFRNPRRISRRTANPGDGVGRWQSFEEDRCRAVALC